ncbi:MAG: VOC family protein [Armatimonadota bacterium]
MEQPEVKVTEIAFSGYSVTDIKRAQSFYEGTLGLKQSSWFGEENHAWVEYDIGPGTLAITNSIPEWKPSSDGGVVSLEVEDFEAAVSRIRADGVTTHGEPQETPVCWMLVIEDPDGNTLILHKRKEEQ